MTTNGVENKTVLLIAFGLLLASACSDSTTPEQRLDTAKSESEQKPKSGYVQSIEKARKVEEQVLEAAEKQKRDIEEQVGGG